MIEQARQSVMRFRENGGKESEAEGLESMVESETRKLDRALAPEAKGTADGFDKQGN